MKTYAVNEIFYSIQGEGMRAGTANVFVRFAGCNLTCREEEQGFDCDTEFTSSVPMTLEEILAECLRVLPDGFPATERAVIFTGGEPALQMDDVMVTAFHTDGWFIAVETNGTKVLPDGIDWITVSPKTAEHTLKQLVAHEVKYVRNVGQGIPKPAVEAHHKLISPAWTPQGPTAMTLAWCIELVKQNPTWRLSLQTHKILGAR
jgi:organic radical activating enzyme